MMPSYGGIDSSASSGGRDRSSSRSFVDHTYRDFSRYLQHAGQVDRHKKVEANFPAKLHQMLSDPHFAHVIVWMVRLLLLVTRAIVHRNCRKYPLMIVSYQLIAPSFQPHGRSWKIVDKELLISNIHKYFALKRYHSFVRQLSGWGFKRLHRPGPDHGCYYHECFLRGIPRLTWLMRRVPTNTGKPVPHIEGEPDFYEINKMHPLLPPDREGHCFSPPYIAGPGTEATKLSTMQEPAASEAALCMYPTSMTHMYNMHHHQSCRPNRPTPGNREFMSNTADMALSMSHLHMAALHENAGQKPMDRESSQPRSSDSSTFCEAGVENLKQEAIQESLLQKDTSLSDYAQYYHSLSCPQSSFPTLTTTTSVHHPSPNHILPAPSTYNYQQYIPPFGNPQFSYSYAHHDTSEIGPATWSSSSTVSYPPAQGFSYSYPLPPQQPAVDPSSFNSSGARHQHRSQVLPCSPPFSFQNEAQHGHQPEEQEHRAADEAAHVQLQGKASDDKGKAPDDNSGNDESVNEFFSCFEF